MKTRIIGTGCALPKEIFTNEDLSKIVDTNDEWISSRTGISTRYLAGEGESCATLAIEAARNALGDAGVSPDDIDMIVVATCSAETNFPNVACQVQEGLGIGNAVAFDLSAACSGFLFALHTVDAYIKTGLYKCALVIGTDTLSHAIDWSDRGTCILFGDGAGACVVKASEVGVERYVQYCDGKMGHVLTGYSGSMKTPVLKREKPMDPLYMDGQAVFKFAVKTVPACIMEVLNDVGCEPEEVRYFVLHQANRRIIQSVAKRLKISEDKFPMNLQKYGNTSAASIPILLDEMNKEGMLTAGDRIILSGFGGGLTWGATSLVW